MDFTFVVLASMTRKFILLTVVYFTVLQVHGSKYVYNPIITTAKGDFKGSVTRSLLGRDIFSFKGIRYAKPPVGELRFQPPVSVEKWPTVYDATEDGASCPQPDVTPTSEDCLFLNVYTTQLPHGNYNPKRPVIVFIHPGGFYSGSGSIFGPYYFLDKDIVLVTINYRLGSLGFLSTGDKLAPGNNGFKDQVLALKWVQENILAFGGDPNLVTISGYSAGGLSVSAHMLSPMSKGLFHRIISMSSTVFAQYPIENHQFSLAQKQARLVGCPEDTSENILNCLKSKPAEALGNSLNDFSEYRWDPIYIWNAVIEPDFGQERFLTEHPIVTISKGNFTKVPVMAGITTEEFSYFAPEVLTNSEWLREMNEEFERVAPIAFIYERNTNKSKYVSQELRKQFLGLGRIDNTSLVGLQQLYADSIVGFGVNRAVKLLAKYSSEKTYYYRFSYQGRFSYVNLPNSDVPYGVVHHDDLIYLYSNVFFPKFNKTDPEYMMVRKLTTLQFNFALTGKPIFSESENVDWTPYTLEKDNYMDIGETTTMKQNLYAERYRVWDRLFPLSDYKM